MAVVLYYTGNTYIGEQHEYKKHIVDMAAR